ncbi:glycoside hydrolase family 30 beta sandwich domain-containing protein, partial [uncultured Marinobacter sp.]|uniref:glycoside hydrolase family 30 beta sandwich domain-containing protein n=1 Tax=uncultured Marinobacter sp. TaxID=187379 RepID=UPI0030D9985C
WITPGSLRIDAVSDNKLVKVTAFRSDRQNELILIVINNSNFEAEMDFSVKNMALQGAVKGEYSDRSNRWKQLPPLTPSDNASFRLTVGPTSVTSLSASLVNPD